MIKMGNLFESYTRIEKATNGLTVADGEAGRGVYFSLNRYPATINYYKRECPYRVINAFKKQNTKIVDFTISKNLVPLIEFMRGEIERMKQSMGSTYISPKINNSNYQRFGRLIQDFIKKIYGDVDGYIVNHEAKGTDLPRGKQLIILNQDAFLYKEL
jgi:hypothetical protein